MLGLVPGCNDAFIMVTFYMSGIVTFGALVSVMVATFGDEAFGCSSPHRATPP